MEKKYKNCVFGYFVKGELKGWRQDTFGTIGLKWAKIYSYYPEQIEIIKNNTKNTLNNGGTKIMKLLFGELNGNPVNIEGQSLDKNSIITQVQETEQEKRSWGEFELKVYEIPFGYDEFEEWKMLAFNNSLPEPLEVHKYLTVNNEN